MRKAAKNRAFWLCWGILTVVAAAFLGFGLFTKDAGLHPALSRARALFLPGKTTSGHHQIEMACESCHTSAFASKDDFQEACVKCHGAELKAADDKHPKSKFTDPRNADRAAQLDATYCITCHIEHRPDTTHSMGVTLPPDFCAHCHGGEFAIAKDRPSHAGMGFETCASSGCHRFHDNRDVVRGLSVETLGRVFASEEDHASPARFCGSGQGIHELSRGQVSAQTAARGG